MTKEPIALPITPAEKREQIEINGLLAAMKASGVSLTNLRLAFEDPEGCDAIKSIVDLEAIKRRRQKNPKPGF